tara:strand:- start:2606 stop:3133 length:528 start_codon:yes stop_codon:yes gene_type:complete
MAVWTHWKSSDDPLTGSNLVGGPFTLIDHNGLEVTERSYPGKLKIIYFGYTYCPDICPTGLSVITQALQMLGQKAEQIKPIFVTVDPARDDVTALASYYDHFHPSFSYLTGSLKQVSAMAKLYKVYFRKASETKDYLVDHSAITYVMSPSDRYLTHFGPHVTAEQMTAFFKTILK